MGAASQVVSARKMNQDDKIALFDMDGSLANFVDALRRDLDSLRAPEEPPLPENLWDAERLSHIRHRMRFIKARPGWWLDLAPICNGMMILDLAKKIGYKRDVLTKGPSKHPAAWKEKIEWCTKHLEPDVQVHIVMNKGLVYGTMLYDDFPEYMDAWLEHRPRGLGIMPVTAANKDYTHERVVKWDGTNLDEVALAMQKAYNRKPNEDLII